MPDARNLHESQERRLTVCQAFPTRVSIATSAVPNREAEAFGPARLEPAALGDFGYGNVNPKGIAQVHFMLLFLSMIFRRVSLKATSQNFGLSNPFPIMSHRFRSFSKSKRRVPPVCPIKPALARLGTPLGNRSVLQSSGHVELSAHEFRAREQCPYKPRP
jgi:hypothetical protein